MKNCKLFSFLIFFIVNFHPLFGTEKDCIYTPCNDYTQPQIIRRLWEVATNVTYYGKKLAETLTEVSQKPDTSKSVMNTIFSQTFWAADIYSDFHSDSLSISCVFENILKFNVSETNYHYVDYDKALEEYVTLIRGIIEFTKTASLAAASCTSIPIPFETRPEECLSGLVVDKFLNKYESIVPHYLKNVIKSLNASNDTKDRIVAIILSALTRGPLNEMFQKVLETPEMLKVMQLRACYFPIPEYCCKSREEDIKSRLDAAGSVVTKFLKELMLN